MLEEEGRVMGAGSSSGLLLDQVGIVVARFLKVKGRQVHTRHLLGVGVEGPGFRILSNLEG